MTTTVNQMVVWGVPTVVQQVQDTIAAAWVAAAEVWVWSPAQHRGLKLALLQLWCSSWLWLGFSPWPWNFHVPGVKVARKWPIRGCDFEWPLVLKDWAILQPKSGMMTSWGGNPCGARYFPTSILAHPRDVVSKGTLRSEGEGRRGGKRKVLNCECCQGGEEMQELILCFKDYEPAAMKYCFRVRDVF